MVPPRDALGYAYEQKLARRPKVRKARGAFYTPAHVVDYLLEHTLVPLLKDKTPDDIRDLRILDPACGGGAFLLGAFECLVKWYRGAVGQCLPAGRGHGREAGVTIESLAVRHLFGLDLDRKAAGIARRSLAAVSGVSGRSLGKNIRHANALDMALSPSFDVILANPPYLNGVEFPAIGLHLRERFQSARGTIDQSILFQELCLALLRPGGRCGVVVPNKFLSAPFGEAFRRFAAENGGLELLADFSTTGVFGRAAVYPVAYVLARGATEAPRTTIEVFDRIEKTGSRVVTTRLRDVATWDQLFSSGLPLLQRLHRDFRPLGEDFEVAASATAAEAYALQEWITDERGAGASFRFITSGGIDRYVHHHGERPMRYLKKDYASPYLAADCPVLSETRRRQYSSEKLIIAGMTREPEVIWDDGSIAGAVSTVQVISRGVHLRLKGLMAILNSSFIAWWFRQTYNSLSLAGGYLRVGSPQVASIPVWPKVETERHRRLCDELVAAGQAATDNRGTVDERIDALVLEWFGVAEVDGALFRGVPRPMGWNSMPR